MRAPSYLYSRAVRPPWAARITSKSVAISASMGRSGTNSRGVAAASASAPPARASAATPERSQRNRAARRTAAGSAPAAIPIASSTRPSDTPVRISPVMTRQSTARSASVARAASSARRPSRGRRDLGQRQRRLDRGRSGLGQPADPEHARLGGGEGPPGEVRDGGGHVAGVEITEELGDQPELVEAPR